MTKQSSRFRAVVQTADGRYVMLFPRRNSKQSTFSSADVAIRACERTRAYVRGIIYPADAYVGPDQPDFDWSRARTLAL